MQNVTTFDSQQRYILLQIAVADKNEKLRDCIAILDTGAPASEFSDEVLRYLGFLEKTEQNISLKPGLQTQKYGKIVLPSLNVGSIPFLVEI